MLALFGILGCPVPVAPPGITGDTGTAVDTDPADTDPADTDPAVDTDTAGDPPDDTGLPDDADGDGGIDIAAGGDDCDDADPTRFVGAPELCDGVDQDCDGLPANGADCTGMIDVSSGSDATWLMDAAWGEDLNLVYADDLDGDGAAELLVECSRCWGPGGDAFFGANLILPGGPVAGAVTVDPLDYGYVYGTTDDQWMIRVGPVPTGDWDGDGVADLAVFAEQTISYQADFWILSGATNDWTTATRVNDAPDAHWQDVSITTLFGNEGIAAGDLDGDGLSDVIVGAGGSDETETWTGAAWLFHGRTGASGEQVYDDEPHVVGSADDPVGSRTFVPGDLDGDGLDDWLTYSTPAGGWRAIYVVTGADTPTSGIATLADVASEKWSLYGAEPQFARAGDLTGDGLDDWMYGDYSAANAGGSSGAVYVVGGLDTSRVDIAPEDGTATWWGGAVGEKLGYQLQTADFDGDGRVEVLARHYDVDLEIYTNMLAAVTTLPGPGDAFPTGLTFDAATLAPPADIDGDGDDDLLFGGWQPGGSGTPQGFTMVAGWAVPWDDAGAW